MHVYAYGCMGTGRGQKTASDVLELGLGVAVTGPTWVLRTVPRPCVRVVSALKQLPSLPARMLYLRQ